MILLEVHSIGRYGMNKVTQVDRLLDFLINVHGFRVYNTGFNKELAGRTQPDQDAARAGGLPWYAVLLAALDDEAAVGYRVAGGGYCLGRLAVSHSVGAFDTLFLIIQDIIFANTTPRSPSSLSHRDTALT